jgi:predicted nucleic acid-binding Zn ribbon protein
MIKKVEENIKIVKNHKYCDDCGKDINHGLACSDAKCEICGKDLL